MSDEVACLQKTLMPWFLSRREQTKLPMCCWQSRCPLRSLQAAPRCTCSARLGMKTRMPMS
eukprot:5530402-Amphidinium_carterae.2